jgi:hypothetical protein
MLHPPQFSDFPIYTSNRIPDRNRIPFPTADIRVFWTWTARQFVMKRETADNLSQDRNFAGVFLASSKIKFAICHLSQDGDKLHVLVTRH